MAKLSRLGITLFRISYRKFCSCGDSGFHVDKLSGPQQGIVLFCLNRPEAKNAMSRKLLDAFSQAISDVQRDSTARVVILKSDVANAFCAGADLKERAKMTAEEVPFMVTKGRQLMSSLEKLPLPVIAAIDGPALGGGLEMALACDIRVAASTAKLGLPETKLAIIPGAGGTQRLPRLVGRAIAKELIFTGRIMDGNQSLQLGIVSHCVEQNSEGNAAFLKALALAEEILPQGPIALKMAKEAIDRGCDVGIESALSIEKLCYDQVIPTKDRLEGIRAFIEKRKPNYRGE